MHLFPHRLFATATLPAPHCARSKQVPVFNPNFLSARVAGDLRVLFYHTEAGRAAVRTEGRRYACQGCCQWSRDLCGGAFFSLSQPDSTTCCITFVLLQVNSVSLPPRASPKMLHVNIDASDVPSGERGQDRCRPSAHLSH